MANETGPGSDVCSLSEAELRERIGMVRRELLPQVRRSEALADGRAFLFDPGAELRRRLEQLVELERRCCDGLDWSLTEADGDLRLTVRGVAPDSDFFAALGAIP